MGQVEADIASAARWWRAPDISDPIDDGTDAEELAARLLRAATDVTDLYIQSPYQAGQRIWRGYVSGTSQRDCVLTLHGQNLKVDLELRDVLAVSHCSNNSASGVSFIGRDGPLLTLWSTRPAAFERWLAVHVPGYSEPVKVAGSADTLSRH
jgi:DMSO/TMAO reductase YedYZ molybdopterin-dependent catalytic subunit